MATVPLSATNIRLLSGIPFNKDYKNTRWFDNLTQQRNYFSSKKIVHLMNQANFQKIEGKHYVDVDKNIDELWNVNYMYFRNTAYDDKVFYAFVTNLEYKNRSNTRVYFMLDSLQSFMFEMKFKHSYVVREHAKLWNSDGTPVINTIDEGLNYGSDYETLTSVQVKPDSYKWLVIVAKQPIAVGDEYTSSVIGTPQPLTYYIVPYKDNDTVPNVFLEKENIGVTLIKPSRVLEMLYNAETAVNNVVSIYVTDFIGLNYTITQSSGTDLITFKSSNNAKYGRVNLGGTLDQLIEVQNVDRFISKNISVSNDKYKLGNVTATSKESKLLMYPYTVLVIDDFKGNRQEYKLEYIHGKGLGIRWKGSLGTSNFNSITVTDYNRSASSTNNIETSNEDALINNSPNDVPIVTDMLSAYLQGNRNSIQTRKGQIDFNAKMNMLGGATGLVGLLAGGGAGGTSTLASGASISVNTLQSMGNANFEIQAIQSKIKDIDNIPPQISKMGSNTAYDYGNNYNGVYVMLKQIKPEYKQVLEDYFNMFGYKSNRVKVPNLKTRKNWNYVQTKGCNIIGDFNNEDLLVIKSAFDNGITLWHNDDIGNYSLDNGVR